MGKRLGRAWLQVWVLGQQQDVSWRSSWEAEEENCLLGCLGRGGTALAEPWGLSPMGKR
ncbi:hypothetical protein M5K25_009380 [Dendrobium thyrsiflorum]|uniref:Uncharacterized protein n=1 Tax=Dendrobium thyrsiflorum TaxID=117978 RepID=A0ABD0V5P6_DENTH